MGPDQTVSGHATGVLSCSSEQELTLFEDLLQAGRGGLARPVVIEGPAGIGKTRLLDDAAASAGSIFGSLVPAGESEGDVTFAALHGLYWLTINPAAEQPLLLAVDDLHWCDRPSLRFLAYLSKRLEDLGVMVVVGLRTAEPGTDPLLIAEVAGAPDVVHVHPGPLSGAGVTDLVRAWPPDDPDPAFVTACQSATGGNPLLLRQLLSSLESDGVRPDAAHAQAVLRHYTLSVRHHAKRIAGKLSMNYSVLGSDGFGGHRILECLGTASFDVGRR